MTMRIVTVNRIMKACGDRCEMVCRVLKSLRCHLRMESRIKKPKIC